MLTTKPPRAKHVLITLEYPPVLGGIARILYERCRTLGSDQLWVITPNSGSTPIPGDQQDYKIWRTPMLGLAHVPILRLAARTFPPLFALFYVLLTEKVEVVECGQATPFPVACFVLKRLFGIRYFVWVHGNDLFKPLNIPGVKWLMPKILREADQVIANSSFLKNKVKQLGVREDHIQIHRHRVDEARFFRTATKSARLTERHGLSGKIVLLTVGRLIQRKGVDKVLDALSALCKDYPQMKYLVIGSGPLEQQLRGMVRDLRLDAMVEFVTEVTDDELNDYYNVADIFIMLSHSDVKRGDIEGLGLVYLEAGRCGLPTIAINDGGIPDVVKHGYSGFLLAPDTDRQTIRDTIETLIKDEALRKTLGRGAVEYSARYAHASPSE